MRPTAIVWLSASGVLGLGALLVARVWLPAEQKKAEPAERPAVSDTVPVVTAKGDVAAGARLEAAKLTVVRLPAAVAPAGAFASVDQVVGPAGAPITLTAIGAREPVLASHLSRGGAKRSVAAAIGEGMRGYTIPVTTDAGGGGHILPGDRVDVLLTRDASREYTPEGGGGRAAKTDLLLQNVLVLAMNLNADVTSTEKETPDRATLEVSLTDAARLAAGIELGDLSLALRRIGAAELAPVAATQAGDTAARPAAVRRASRPRPAPAARRPSLVVVNGAESTTVTAGDPPV